MCGAATAPGVDTFHPHTLYKEKKMEFPEELKYTEEHEWALVEGDVVTIGITDFAQDALGDVVFVELPEVGTVLEVGKPFGVVESVKAVSDVYAPLSGEVVEVNEELPDAPETINTSPYEDGWMIKIKVADPSMADELMDSDAYRAFTEEEA
jgi:glycine cleavage system H protein